MGGGGEGRKRQGELLGRVEDRRRVERETNEISWREREERRQERRGRKQDMKGDALGLSDCH